MPAPFTPTGRLQQAVAPALPHGDPSNLGLARELLDNRALLLAVMRGFSVGDPRVTVGGEYTAVDGNVGADAVVNGRGHRHADGRGDRHAVCGGHRLTNCER